ncbi:MAG: tRNA (N6-isopentenyl adenosine(37)-C2)-methylthiotransferase MiaB, partial [Candidatus Eremiobacteraeota bacterium]|nr:tRNA (N6-isopentenyl adenosine(37)-C2)-methylthiotransferase MiaB [Candidatus Eremiobacteraeota bacterium]
MTPQVPQEERLRRLQAISAAQNDQTRRFHERFIGETVSALVSGPSKKDPTRMAGKTGHNVTVVWPRSTDAAAARSPVANLVIEQAQTWGLVGRVA